MIRFNTIFAQYQGNKYLLNKFACDPNFSKGRFFFETESDLRTPFQRDRDRIIHSSAFRRLKHKTQVFIEHEGDHYRTRLTHSLEVSQLARTIANVLGINSDLTETIALAHDLGHTPFGHTGEETLNFCMDGNGGFNHNFQTFRIVTLIEKSYASFSGLNLTWETLDGILKHSGPLNNNEINNYLFFDKILELNCQDYPSLEAQAASISDDIAYNSHDLDDGLRARLFKFDDLIELPIIDEAFHSISLKYPDEPKIIKQKETLRLFINTLVVDAIKQSKENLENFFGKSVEAVTLDDIRGCKKLVVNFSPICQKSLEFIRGFLFKKMYRHNRVEVLRNKAKIVVKELFEVLIKNPDLLPKDWTSSFEESDSTSDLYRLVSDYISGMTDRYAIQEHSRLTGVQIFP